MSRPDFEIAFAEAQTGRGHRFKDVDALSQFSVYAAKRNAIVQIVEVFEVRGEWEVPRIDLSLYGDEPLGPPGAERIATFSERLRDMLRDAASEQREFLFDVWVADAE